MIFPPREDLDEVCADVCVHGRGRVQCRGNRFVLIALLGD